MRQCFFTGVCRLQKLVIFLKLHTCNRVRLYLWNKRVCTVDSILYKRPGSSSCWNQYGCRYFHIIWHASSATNYKWLWPGEVVYSFISESLFVKITNCIKWQRKMQNLWEGKENWVSDYCLCLLLIVNSALFSEYASCRHLLWNFWR